MSENDLACLTVFRGLDGAAALGVADQNSQFFAASYINCPGH